MTSSRVATLERPVYGMSQAARLLGLRTDSLRRWVDGYERAGKAYSPVIRDERTGVDDVTWGEFIEAGYLREYRARRVSLQYLRPVIHLLRKELGIRYPLATLKPYTSGKQLAFEIQKAVGLDPALNLVIIDRNGNLQLADPAQAFFEKIDFAAEGIRDAERIYPLGRSVPIALDPKRSFGEPTFPAGVRIETVAELAEAGEPREYIAELYHLDIEDIDLAVTYAERFSRSAA